MPTCSLELKKYLQFFKLIFAFSNTKFFQHKIFLTKFWKSFLEIFFVLKKFVLKKFRVKKCCAIACYQNFVLKIWSLFYFPFY